jgi:hypothetical protein
MATSKAETTAAADNPKPALAPDFEANEPTAKSGTDAEGKPDGTLGPNQVERAAVEALHSLQPQPTANQIKNILAALAEVDPKTKQPKHKFKTAKEAGEAAVALVG